MSCSTGFAIGDLHLCRAMEDSEVDFHHSPVPITEALAKFDLVQTEAKFLLVVEKDSIFQRLLDEHWADKFPKSILVTVSFCNSKIKLGYKWTFFENNLVFFKGRGYPDICTRRFLAWLSDQLPQLPMLALVDADPYGNSFFH